MYLSYSGYKTYVDCPRAYWHRYINKTVSPKPDNRVHMLYGETVGRLFEAFYNEQIWKNNVTATLLERVERTMQKIISAEVRKGGVFNWTDPTLKPGTRSLSEIEVEVRETIPRGLKTIRHHRLLGQDAAAEVRLDETVDGKHILAGRADILMRRVRPHGDLVILDGKGSRWRDKYVNRNQLLWYSMLYWLRSGSIPDRLGFLFWRFEPEESVDWSDVTLSGVQSLHLAAMGAIEGIENGQRDLVQLKVKDPGAKVPGMIFWANPSPDCKLCNYLPLCPEGSKKPPKGSALGVEEGDFTF
jgi:hypothetical protein